MSSLAFSSELRDKIESVQKRTEFYKEGKIPYSFLLKAARITTLKERREKICLGFPKSVISDLRTEDLLPEFHNPIRPQLPRSASLAIPTYCLIHAVTDRFRKSFIPFILEHLNNHSWLCPYQNQLLRLSSCWWRIATKCSPSHLLPFLFLFICNVFVI